MRTIGVGSDSSDEHEQRADVLIEAVKLAVEGRLDEGEKQLSERWPHRGLPAIKRSVKDLDRLKTFLADGFRCRYTGERLFFTPLLEAMSVLWPGSFPVHPNWKSENCHDAYWSHTASLDHKVPVAIGGQEIEENWVTTSAARNMVRSRYSLASLGWESKPRTRADEWDGGVQAFLDLMKRYSEKLESSKKIKYLKKWERLARKAQAELADDGKR